MSNRGRDDNDLFDADFGEFDDQGFAEQELEPAPANGGAPRNIRFLFLAALMVGVILVGVILIIWFALQQGEENRRIALTVAFIETSNAQVMLDMSKTVFAKSLTPTPSATPTPSDTPTNTPTSTPTDTATPTDTPSPSPTPTVDAEATNLAGTLTAIALALTLSPPELTGTANALATQNAALTLTAAAAATTSPTPTPTLGIIFFTPIPGTPGTPIPITLTPATLEPGVTVVTVVPTVTPSVTAVPKTGLFDDLGLGGASPSNLPIIGLAALGLVAVIVVARRLRVKT